MAFTFGFYNSLNGDRKYDALQMSEIFDGIIQDGIFDSIGQIFAVTASTGMLINVGTGRAWFNHTWNKNDSIMVLTVPQADITRARYDAVVLEVNSEDEVRENTIKIIKGPVASTPVKPSMTRTEKVNQYPLAYIMVPAAATEITAANIEITVGRGECPFVTGILDSVDITNLFNQWNADFNAWFSNVKAQLTGNVVTNLQRQIDENKDKIEQNRVNIQNIENTFQIRSVTKTDVFSTSGRWTNPTNKTLTVSVRLFGGGGGGCSMAECGGGGGGHMTYGSYTISANSSVNITIGNGGAAGSNGGTTSFGAYLSANGGDGATTKHGASGGTGGGGGCRDAYGVTGNGGSGSYGGGGGGAGGNTDASYTDGGWGGTGGSGGTYGGGGGGGGAGTGRGGKTPMPGGSGGAGGTNGGGSGGAGGSVTWVGNNSTSNVINPGFAGNSGVNTNGMSSLEFKGSGFGGANGSAGSGSYAASGGGGGGGGGYGGNGGSGGNGVGGGSEYGSATGGGGGGGGGYGAAGGAGTNGALGTYTNPRPNGGGGGGGGGYGGKGGIACYQGTGFGAGGGSTGNSTDTYKTHLYGGGGGGGYGTTQGNTMSSSGVSGVCIVTYTIKEITLS